jgi:hypothetical protein
MDLLDNFEALLETYQYAVWLSKQTDAGDAVARNAIACIDFLIENDATVTFAAPPIPPTEATGHDDYEWDIERRNWFRKDASADERDRLMGGV